MLGLICGKNGENDGEGKWGGELGKDLRRFFQKKEKLHQIKSDFGDLLL